VSGGGIGYQFINVVPVLSVDTNV